MRDDNNRSFWDVVHFAFPVIGEYAHNAEELDEIPDNDLELFADWLGDRELF